MDHNTARQEVRVSAAKFAGARSGQQEAETAGLRIDDGLHTIEQLRNALHFVDENGANAFGHGQKLSLETFGRRNVLTECSEACEIQCEVRLQRTNQRGFPYLPRPEKQRASFLLKF